MGIAPIVEKMQEWRLSMVWARLKKQRKIGGENSTPTKPAWPATTQKDQETMARPFEGRYAARQHSPEEALDRAK